VVNKEAGIHLSDRQTIYTGAIGGAGNKVGAPLAEDGMIGKNFKS
jgi:hypothetical protein